jgi:hypothetical protein
MDKDNLMNIKKAKKDLKVILAAAKKQVAKTKRKISRLTLELKSTLDAIEQASSQYSESDPEVDQKKHKKSKLKKK